MTGNPLSGHTKANESSMAGTAKFTDGLTDGEHIQSPTLTNYLEGIHGNGILLEEDTAYGATNKNVPEDLPGIVEQNTNSDRIRVTGGTAIIDGVPYQFADGPGGTLDIDLTRTSPNRRATYTALTAGQEALIVVYVSTKDTESTAAVKNVQWEMGTAITTATNAYPITPSAFLSDPKAADGLATNSKSFQSVVLAVLRVVYNASAPGDLKISVTEINDKRIFIRPTPLYLTSVTSGAVGATTAIDNHAEVDALITGTTGDLTGSRLGALWQSYNADGDTILYYSSKDSGGTRHTHVLGPIGYVTSSPSSTTTFTFNEGQVFVLNPSGAIQFNPSGTFPLGHLVYVTNEAAHGTNGVTFDNSGIGTVLLGKESGVFVYTGSAWKNVMLASGAVSPNGHGASGNVQLSDGGGGFTSDDNLNFNTSTDALKVNDLKISSSSNHVTIQNETQDKDIIFKVNDGGVETEVMRISGDDGRIGIGGVTAPAAQLHLRSAVTSQPEIRLENTNADTQEAAIRFMKNTASPAASDDIGLIRFEGENDAGANHLYSYIMAQMLDVSDSAEAGEILFFPGHKGAQYQALAVTGSSAGDGEVCVNDAGRDDINFRVESNTQTHMLFVDAGNDGVGIGTDTPATKLEVSGDTTISRSADLAQTRTLSIEGARNATGTDYARIDLKNYDSNSGSPATYVGARIAAKNEATGVDDGTLMFSTADAGTLAERMRITDTGDVGIGTNDPQGVLHVKHSGTSYTALFETDDDGSSAAPDVALYRNSATPANGDDLGHLIWRGTTDDGDSTVTRGNIVDIFAELQVATTGAESGKMHLRTKKAGSMNKRISIEATKTIINQDNVDADFIVEGVGNANLIFADSSQDKVGIGHAPSATLDILTGGTFRNTRLLTVSVSAGTTLTEAAHAGRYNICAGNVTLPSTSTAGEHYAILNTTGGNITIGRNFNRINGDVSDFTLATFKAATCIAIGSNNWMVVG